MATLFGKPPRTTRLRELLLRADRMSRDAIHTNIPANRFLHRLNRQANIWNTFIVEVPPTQRPS